MKIKTKIAYKIHKPARKTYIRIAFKVLVINKTIDLIEMQL